MCPDVFNDSWLCKCVIFKIFCASFSHCISHAMSFQCDFLDIFYIYFIFSKKVSITYTRTPWKLCISSNIYIFTSLSWIHEYEFDKVRCRYDPVIFLTNPHKRQPIARPWGRGMVCLLWVQSEIKFCPSRCRTVYTCNTSLCWIVL